MLIVGKADGEPAHVKNLPFAKNSPAFPGEGSAAVRRLRSC
jgi:hypothetical protein